MHSYVGHKRQDLFLQHFLFLLSENVPDLSVTCRFRIPHPGPEYPIQLSANYTVRQKPQCSRVQEEDRRANI